MSSNKSRDLDYRRVVRRVVLGEKHVHMYLCTTHLDKDLVYDYQLDLSKIPKFTKINPITLTQHCNHSICPGPSILFLYVPPHKAWLLKSLPS